MKKSIKPFLPSIQKWITWLSARTILCAMAVAIVGTSNPAWAIPPDKQINDIGDLAPIAIGGFRRVVDGEVLTDGSPAEWEGITGRPALVPITPPESDNNETGHNSYSWSQGWYDKDGNRGDGSAGASGKDQDQSELYVGTVRDLFCALGNETNPLIAPCNLNEGSSELSGLVIPFGPQQRAEIWRYTPSPHTNYGGANGSWERVHQSPMNGYAGQEDTLPLNIDYTFPEIPFWMQLILDEFDIDLMDLVEDGLKTQLIDEIFGNVTRDVGVRNQSVCRTLGEPGRDRLYATVSGVPGNVLMINDDGVVNAEGTAFEVASTDGLKTGLTNFMPPDFELPFDVPIDLGLGLGGLLLPAGTMIELGGTSDADIGHRGLECFNGYLITSPASSIDSDSEDVSENPFLYGNADPSMASSDPDISDEWQVLADFRNFPSIDYDRDGLFDHPKDCEDPVPNDFTQPCGATGHPEQTVGDQANYGAFDVKVLGTDLWVAVSNRGKDTTLLLSDDYGVPTEEPFPAGDYGTPSDAGGMELWRGDGSHFGTECTSFPDCDDPAYNRIVWNKVIDIGAGRRLDERGPDNYDNGLGTFGIVDGELFLSLWESGFEQGSRAEMIRVTPNAPGDETWELLIGAGRRDFMSDAEPAGGDPIRSLAMNGSGTDMIQTGQMVCDPANLYQDNYAPNTGYPPPANLGPGDGDDSDCYPSTGRNLGFGPKQDVGVHQFYDNTDSNSIPESNHPSEGDGQYFWRFGTHRNAGASPTRDELFMGTLKTDYQDNNSDTPNFDGGGTTVMKTYNPDDSDPETNAGDSWEIINDNGLLNPLNYGIRSMQSAVLPDDPGYGFGTEQPVFFVGTANPLTNAPDVPELGTEGVWGGTSMFMGTFDFYDTTCGDGVASVGSGVEDSDDCLVGAPVPLILHELGLFPITPVEARDLIIFSNDPQEFELDSRYSYDFHGGSITEHRWFLDTAITGRNIPECDALTDFEADGVNPEFSPTLAAGRPNNGGAHDVTLRIRDDDGLYSCQSLRMTVSTDGRPDVEITEAMVDGNPIYSTGLHFLSNLSNDPIDLGLGGRCTDPFDPANPVATFMMASCEWSGSAGITFFGTSLDNSAQGDEPSVLDTTTTATIPVSEIECGNSGICDANPQYVTLTGTDAPNAFTDDDNYQIYVHSVQDDGDPEANMEPVCESRVFEVLQGETLTFHPSTDGVCTDPDGEDSALYFNLSGSQTQNLALGTLSEIPEYGPNNDIEFVSDADFGLQYFAMRAQVSNDEASDWVNMAINVVPPSSAAIDLKKELVNLVDNNDGTATATYTVTAINRGKAGGNYDIVEALDDLSPGITVATSTPPTIIYASGSTGNTEDVASSVPTVPGPYNGIWIDEEGIVGMTYNAPDDWEYSEESWTVTVVYDIGTVVSNPLCSGGGGISNSVFSPQEALNASEDNNTVCTDFGPMIELEKSVISGTQLDVDTYQVEFSVTATNNGLFAGQYDIVEFLDPAPEFSAGTSTGFTVATSTPPIIVFDGGDTDASSVTSPFVPNVAGVTVVSAESLPPGSSESWTVTVAYDVNDDDPDQPDVEYTPLCDDGGGFTNEIGVLGDEDPDNNSACFDLGASVNTLELTKTVGVPNYLGADQWEVDYTITVTNNAVVGAEYGIFESLDEDANDGVWIPNDFASVAYGSGSAGETQFTSPINLDGDVTSQYIVVDETIGAGNTESWIMTVVWNANQADNSFNPICRSGGFRNNARLRVNGENGPWNEACADIPEAPPEPPPAPASIIDISKAIDGEPVDNDNGTWTMNYIITVSNTGTLPGAYDLIDTVEPGTGISFNSATVTYPSGQADADGSNTHPLDTLTPFDSGDSIVIGENLAAGKSEIWNVTVNYDVNRLQVTQDHSSALCTTPVDGIGGGGFANVVSTSVLTDVAGNNEACAELILPPEESDILDFMPAIISAALKAQGKI